jgi:hypothetical protein
MNTYDPSWTLEQKFAWATVDAGGHPRFAKVHLDWLWDGWTCDLHDSVGIWHGRGSHPNEAFDSAVGDRQTVTSN